METIPGILVQQLAAKQYVVQDNSGGQESTNSIHFTNFLDPTDTIAIKMVDVPHCNETMIYVKAKKLFHRIMTLKMNKVHGSSSLSTRIAITIMRALFPPEVSVPTLPHVPELCVAQICAFLEVKDIISLGFTCTSLSSSILRNQKLWNDLYDRDFVGHTVAASDTSSALYRYRQMYAQRISLQRLHQPRAGRLYVHNTIPHPFVFPTLPSPLSEFMGPDPDTHSLGAFDPFAPFGTPIPRPRFDD